MLKKLFSLSTLGLVISLPAAFATPITNNTSVNVSANVSGMVGTKVADTGVLNFITSPFVSGTLEQQVYREAGGTLDFYYLVMNNSSSKDSISRITTTDFTGFTTNVSYLTPTTGVVPTSADRSLFGDTVGFDFKSNGINTLTPNSSSAWLEIATNATSYTFGTTSVLDGGSGTVTTYAPTPEPMSMGLLGAGLAGFGLLATRRRSVKK